MQLVVPDDGLGWSQVAPGDLGDLRQGKPGRVEMGRTEGLKAEPFT